MVFGMKGHIGMNVKEKTIHSAEVAPHDVQDSQAIARRLDDFY